MDLAELARSSAHFNVDHPIGAYEATKLIIMFPVVVFKWMILAVAVFYAWAVLHILLLGHRRDFPMHPLR
jgi:hypothetical protein